MENNAFSCLIQFVSLVIIILIGCSIRRHLPDDHLSADSRDTIKLTMGLVATMTALLLGLLVSSAKGTYDTQRTEVIQMAAKAAFLNRVLIAYGEDASAVRTEFRTSFSETIESIWPEGAGSQELLSISLAEEDALYAAIEGLAPRNDVQRALKVEAASLAMDLEQLRFLMLAQAVPAIPGLLMTMIGCWLLIIFLYFSLLAPPNGTTVVSLVAAAISVAGAVFLIMELDQPFDGPIQISSDLMASTLEQIGK